MDLGDLKVRISADVSDVSKAVEQAARQGLQAAQQQAKTTEAALKGAASASTKLQESLSAISEYLADAGLTADEVAEAMTAIGGGATKAAEGANNAAAAAKNIAQPTKDAATAADNLQKGFSLSTSTLVRAGAALVGVGLGINVIAGAARLAHQAIADLVDGQLALERSARNTAALYGTQATSIQALARAQAAAPDQVGTVAQRLQYLNDSAFLQSRYGLNVGDQQLLTSSASRLSRVLGDTSQQQDARQAAFLQFVQNGGPGLRNIGLNGDNLELSRFLGGSSETQIGTLTAPQVDQARTLQATIAANRAVLGGQGAAAPLLDSKAQAEKAQQGAASALHDAIERMATSDVTNPLNVPLEGGGYGTAAARDAQQAQIDQLTAAKAQADAAAADATQKWTAALGDAQKAIDQATQDLAKLGLETNTAGFRLAGAFGSIEDALSVAHADVNVQAQSAVAGRAVGPGPSYARSPLDRYTQAEQSAENQAYQEYVALLQQQQLRTQGSAVRDSLNRAAGQGTPDQQAAARQALQNLSRRNLGAQLGAQAGVAGDLAARAQTEAQSDVSTIQVRQDERRLDAAQQLADYKKQELELQGELSPLLLQQATLQDRIVQASRDNLETRRTLIAAEQAALPSRYGLQDIDYQQQLLVAKANASRASILRGNGATQDLGALRQQYYELDVQKAEQTPGALEAQHGVDLAQRQQEQDSLQREARLADLDQEQRKLEDQLIPLQEADRLVQAKNDAAQRAIDLADLQDTAELTAAKHRLDEANQLKLDADAAQRAAQDYAAGLDLGASAAERSAAALQRARDTLNDMVAISATSAEVNARLQNGLGAGGLGGAVSTASSTPSGITIILVKSNDPAGIRQEISSAVDQLLSGVATTGTPAPSTVGGAGR